MTKTTTRRFPLSTAPHQETAIWSEQPPLTWGEFLDWLHLEKPHNTKDCGGYFLGELEDGLKRKYTIVSRSAITLDADKASHAFIADTMMTLEGTSAVFHTTYHHTEESPRYRVLIPLDRDVAPAEFVLISRALMSDLGKEQFDGTCAEPYRMMHLPSALDKDTFHWQHFKGRPLNADTWLERGKELGLDSDPEPVTEQGSGDYDEGSTPTQEQRDKAAAVLEKACREVRHLLDEKRGEPFAGRNDACIHWLPTLYRFVLGDVLTEEQVDTAVWSAVQDAEGPDDFDRDEYESVSRSSWGYAQADGGQRPTVDTVEDDFALQDEIFDSSEILTHIRTAAHARMVGPEALLCYVLARVLTELPPDVVLPAAIASTAPLNLGIAVVGDSGAGKSGLLAVSRELLGLVGQDQLPLERNIGSGEGVAETFLETEMQAHPTTGKLSPTGRKVLVQDPRRIMLADEVDQLAAGQTRSGATIAPTLRTALTGGPLGQENATAANKRHVPAGSYRLVFLIGVQPERSGALLDRERTGAGTPQRFVWVLADDLFPPDKDVEWPGPLDWQLPSVSGEIVYPSHIRDDIRTARRQQQKRKVSPVEGHKLLTRLKVATALFLLHGEKEISDRWWHVAGLIIESSMRQQEGCRRVLAKTVEKVDEARGHSAGRAKIAEEEIVSDIGGRKAAIAIRKKLTPEWQSFSDLRASLWVKHRPHAEEGLELLRGVGQVEVEEVEYHGQPGHRVRGVGE